MTVRGSRDIIVAQASAGGRAGVAVLRVSGPALAGFAQALTGIVPRARHAHFASFHDAAGQVLDQGLLLWFPGPQSYTGEDVLELHTHGGDVAPRRVLLACLALGSRVAGPGEFTRRAFELGKLDLAQAEAVADLIEAGSEAAARGALRSLSGEFSRRVQALQQALITLRVQAEGGLDFPEEDLPLHAHRAQGAAAAALAGQVAALLAEGQRSQVMRTGRRVVLLGAPNVGKSSLLNRLAGEDLAIVSPHAGTTRDTVRSELELKGLRLEIVDTAGVRADPEAIERLGIERTWAAVARADLVIRLWACDQPGQAPPADQVPESVPVLEVFNKADLVDAEQVAALRAGGHAQALMVSALTGEGMDALAQAMLDALHWSAAAEPAFLARERHLAALSDAREHLQRAAEQAAEELLAEELRLAQRAMDSILGQFVADDLLGEIFSRFCIGK